jgi:hypothetical protein
MMLYHSDRLKKKYRSPWHKYNDITMAFTNAESEYCISGLNGWDIDRTLKLRLVATLSMPKDGVFNAHSLDSFLRYDGWSTDVARDMLKENDNHYKWYRQDYHIQDERIRIHNSYTNTNACDPHRFKRLIPVYWWPEQLDY